MTYQILIKLKYLKVNFSSLWDKFNRRCKNLLSKRKKDQVKLNIYKENIGIDKINLNINENKNSNYFNINFGGLKFYGLDEDNSDRSFEWNPKEQNFGEVGWSTFLNKNELKIKKAHYLKKKIIDYGDEGFYPL